MIEIIWQWRRWVPFLLLILVVIALVTRCGADDTVAPVVNPEGGRHEVQRDSHAGNDAVGEPGSNHAGHAHQGPMHSAVATKNPEHPLESSVSAWTCAMHPSIQRQGPGQCPICGMNLIPVARDTAVVGDRPTAELSLSSDQVARLRIATVPVERRHPKATIRLVGKVAYDETRLAHITAWVAGRIEDLFVDYTGLAVQQGDHMVALYSPELLSAQEELLQALRSQASLAKSTSESVRRSARGTVDAARDKLRLLGLTVDQITALEQRGDISERVTLFAPTSGVVISRDAHEGMYVDVGTRIFTVADLDAVWVELEAYEPDLQWLRYGQTVTFGIEAYPGERFTGMISFIDPVLDPQTRTVGVRVNADNRDGRLKPGMLVRAEVVAQLAEQGRVYDPSLAGKWVSPMHPEIVKDAPGQCDICGMDLVPAESLGYAAASRAEHAAPLIIPATAPLLTGTRAIVYVELPHTERPTYAGREVVLGPRAGDHYVVVSGLSEGERVVASGSFRLDSAMQLQAKHSMMNPHHAGDSDDHNGAEGDRQSHHHHHDHEMR